MNESQFIIDIALKKFNGQFHTNFTVEQFDIMSIDPRNGYDLSYEIFSKRSDDHLRLNVHFKYGKTQGLANYELTLDNSFQIGILGDEIFVSTGIMDRYYKESGQFKFAPIVPEDINGPILLTEDNQALLTEEGDTITLEEAIT